jgi:hypothetical protein
VDEQIDREISHVQILFDQTYNMTMGYVKEKVEGVK